MYFLISKEVTDDQFKIDQDMTLRVLVGPFHQFTGSFSCLKQIFVGGGKTTMTSLKVFLGLIFFS